ncbi:MAG TPA: VOC family protein [Mesotoga prima]|uniref:VOC family protein n=1 Tax=Mesotoga prima TaxID=1184387 RepID=UPI002C45F24D|nr:VOC family protein [Mesotoga prima]HPE54739.1 VOC family protein [Mesotoga prima]
MEIQVATISVSSLERARVFYEEILGFEPDIFYEQTNWQSYKLDGTAGFGIIETPGLKRNRNSDILNFRITGVEELWNRIKDSVEIDTPLETTPYGILKFVVRDPDGFRIGFVEKIEA